MKKLLIAIASIAFISCNDPDLGTDDGKVKRKVKEANAADTTVVVKTKF